MDRTFVVHPWSGTVLDAEDGVIIVKIPAHLADSMNDAEIVYCAVNHGSVIPKEEEQS